MCGNSPGFVISPPTINPVGYVHVGILTTSTVVNTDKTVNDAACVDNFEYSSHSLNKN